MGAMPVKSLDEFSNGTPFAIQNVWATNFEEEMENMMAVAENGYYIAFDTEYPGLLQQPTRATSSSDTYSALRENVDVMKLIQLGLAFADEDCNVLGCWQFNFHFDNGVDRYAPDSMDFLAQAGFDFTRHATEGLSMEAFGERLTASGLVLSDEVHWISFHGMYDFAYLLKLLTGDSMPVTLPAFDEALDTFFPKRLDIKRHLPKGSLSRLGEDYGIRRKGIAHQGGSDAFLTLEIFLQMEKGGHKAATSQSDGKLFGLHQTSDEATSKDKSQPTNHHEQILAAQRAAAQNRPRMHPSMQEVDHGQVERAAADSSAGMLYPYESMAMHNGNGFEEDHSHSTGYDDYANATDLRSAEALGATDYTHEADWNLSASQNTGWDQGYSTYAPVAAPPLPQASALNPAAPAFKPTLNGSDDEYGNGHTSGSYEDVRSHSPPR